ncbi:hypothetical protein [Acidiphilium sp.]|uniref:hypothetical protein n=1 Tax=Acidiphilium sp. TaxID=527 RepID=UPI003D007F38
MKVKFMAVSLPTSDRAIEPIGLTARGLDVILPWCDGKPGGVTVNYTIAGDEVRLAILL